MKEWKSIKSYSKEEEGIFVLETDIIHFSLQLVNKSYSGIEAIYYMIKEHHLTSLKNLPGHQQIVIFYHYCDRNIGLL